MKTKPRPRSDDADAFLRERGGQDPIVSNEDVSELLGEGFIQSVLTGDDADEELHEEATPEEVGGPFVKTDGRQEFGQSRSPDAPQEPAEREPFPTAVRSGRASTPGRTRR